MHFSKKEGGARSEISLSHPGTDTPHNNVLQEKQSKHQCVPLQVNHLIIVLCDDTNLRQNLLCLVRLLNILCNTSKYVTQSVKGKTFFKESVHKACCNNVQKFALQIKGFDKPVSLVTSKLKTFTL